MRTRRHELLGSLVCGHGHVQRTDVLIVYVRISLKYLVVLREIIKADRAPDESQGRCFG